MKKRNKKWFKYILIIIGVLATLFAWGRLSEIFGDQEGAFSLIFIIIILGYTTYSFYKQKLELETENFNLKENYREDLEEMAAIIEEYIEDEDTEIFKNKTKELKEKIKCLEKEIDF